MSASGSTARPLHRRQLKNFLLDRSFQLKWAGYLSGVAVLLSVGLGALLWSTSQAMVGQSQEAVQTGRRAVDLGRELVDENRKVTAVVRMSIVQDEAYAGDPELLSTFRRSAEEEDLRVAQKQADLEAHAAALGAQAEKLAAGQRTMFLSLVVALSAFALLLAAAGVVITHRVAGPVLKLRRQLERLGDGSLALPSKLRRGDELGQLMSALEGAIVKLRAERERELALLDGALAEAPAGARAPLEALREALRAPLES